MKKRYTRNYIKIYISQTLAILLNLSSLFIVLPHLTINKPLFGIYSVCISVTIFFSYIDLGFINAGIKYGAEFYVKGDLENEKKAIGFSMAVFSCLALLFCLVIGFLAFHQGMLFSHITGDEALVARKLLLILAGSSLVVVMQRCLQMIFAIRVEDYYFQAFQIVFSIFKIASVFYFFQHGTYDIVGYFLFCQICTLTALLLANFLGSRRYRISFFSLLRYFRFNKEVFAYTKGLAFGTLFLTISWILYYELDPYVLAKLSDPPTVALYSVGLTLLAFYRSIFGTLFGPFNVRFNHIIGAGDDSALRSMYSSVIVILLPLIVLPVLAGCILTKPFILSWVGKDFSNSVTAARFLLLTNLWGFVSYPSGILIVAKKEMKLMYIIGTIQPILYWVGVALLYRYLGFTAFAVCTLLVFASQAVFYTIYSFRYLRTGFSGFARKYLGPALPAILVLVAILLIVEPRLPGSKGVKNLVEVIGCGAVAVGAAIVVYYFCCKEFRDYIRTALAVKSQG